MAIRLPTALLNVSAGLILRARETLVTLIYLYTDAGHPSPYDTDVLNVSAGPHTPSQGDPGDHDIRYIHLLMIPIEVFMFQQGLIPRAKKTLVTLIYDTPTPL